MDFPAAARRCPTLPPAPCRTAGYLLGLGLLASLLVGGVGGCSSSGDDLNVEIPKLIDKWQGPSNVQLAGDLFNATNPDARRIAVAYISTKKWGHEPPYMKAYHMLATTDPDALVRAQALRALGTSHQPAVADDLIKGLENTNPIIRRDAAAAMDDVINPSQIDPLLEHLKNDADAQSRINCARALAHYPHEARVVRGLVEALDDSDVAVVNRAWQSLQATTGQTRTVERRDWLDYLSTLTPETHPS